MRILNKLTIASVKRNKKRSIVTMIGVALSVALIFTVVAIPMSAMNTLKNYQLETYGDFHYAFETSRATNFLSLKTFQTSRATIIPSRLNLVRMTFSLTALRRHTQSPTIRASIL